MSLKTQVLTSISTKIATTKRKRKGLLGVDKDDELLDDEASLQDDSSRVVIDGAQEAATSKRWTQLAVPGVSRGVLERSERVINSVQLDVTLTRPEGPAGDADCTVPPITMATPTRLALRVEAEPTARERENIAAHGLDPVETMHLATDDNELQLLLIHQPGLYERARSRWAALGAVASWVVARLVFERRARQWHKACSDAPDPALKNRLRLDRNVPLPPQIARAPPLPAPCVFSAEQDGDALVVHLAPAGPVGEPKKETPYRRRRRLFFYHVVKNNKKSGEKGTRTSA
jgi:hypothetical protein